MFRQMLRFPAAISAVLSAINFKGRVTLRARMKLRRTATAAAANPESTMDFNRSRAST